ncbi:histone acetyltransferase hac5 [Quercus suber]|uniref:Histone acetyltransferase hac5 n=1 Tax=Quercus suber TaxID=58331 RepID=A0AAW0L4M8_QUESU
MVSQPPHQKQHHGGQNSRILHSLSSQMGSGIRSGLQQKAYGFTNGALNGGGIGLMGNNLQLVKERGTSEGYLSATSYSNSPKPFQPHFDQHQQPIMQAIKSNLQATQQAAYIKTPSVDQSEKMNFQASIASRDNLLHSHQQHQFQQKSHQFQQQQFVQQQRQQN